MSPLYDISFVLNNRSTSHDVSGSIEIDEFVVGDETFVPKGPAVWQLALTYVGEGVLASGTIVLPVVATCCRCLEPFPLEISAEFDILFYNKPTLDNDGDPLPSIDDEGRIELESELIESLIVEAPSYPLHSEECKGLCYQCGANLNETTCACGEKLDPSHPFAALDSLIESNTE